MNAPAAASRWLVPDWPAPACVRAAVTTRLLPGVSRAPFDAFNLGAHCGDDAAAVAANRAAIVPLLALPSSPRWLRQVHGVDVACFADAPDRDGESAPDAVVADAAVTRTADIVLCVLTADCLPLLVCADDGSEVAAIHAGWRGLAAGAIEGCIARMRTPAGRLIVWIGPAIGARSYEVGEEVRSAFVAQAATADAAFVSTRSGHWHCDLPALARLRLAAIGVDRVYGGNFDTVTDARFYSHRRDKASGRFASLIWIADAVPCLPIA
jgi:YfiH family protein